MVWCGRVVGWGGGLVGMGALWGLLWRVERSGVVEVCMGGLWGFRVAGGEEWVVGGEVGMGVI